MFSLALLTSVVLSFFALPWGFGALPFAVTAFVLGIVAMVVMRSEASPTLWILVVLGTLVSSSLTLDYIAAAVLYDELVAFQACSQDAITIAGAARCSHEFEAAAVTRLGDVGLSLSHLLGAQP
jgi:hypothetical protein